eukprot:365157-Chlamydomonas_euryale.AAC.41
MASSSATGSTGWNSTTAPPPPFAASAPPPLGATAAVPVGGVLFMATKSSLRRRRSASGLWQSVLSMMIANASMVVGHVTLRKLLHDAVNLLRLARQPELLQQQPQRAVNRHTAPAARTRVDPCVHHCQAVRVRFPKQLAQRGHADVVRVIAQEARDVAGAATAGHKPLADHERHTFDGLRIEEFKRSGQRRLVVVDRSQADDLCRAAGAAAAAATMAAVDAGGR